MRRFLVAVQFLTRLPTPRVASDETDFAASIRWFPAVGLLIGVIVAGGGWAGLRIDPWAGAMAALALWVGVTGALHLDGLADIADGCGAAHGDRQRLLAAMADPHVGSFGVVAIVLQCLAKLVLLHALIAGAIFVPIMLIPFAARIGPLVWARWLPSLHAGLGARFAHAASIGSLAIWFLLLAIAAVTTPALLAAPLLMTGWAFWLRRAIGGISGDGHGAGIELVETGLLLASTLVSRL